jgi:hypothetical protein
MKANKIERLQAAGWKVGNAEDFLQLGEEEVQLAALKLPVVELAQRKKSSQLRTTRIDPTLLAPLRNKLPRGKGSFDLETFRSKPYGRATKS